MLESVGTWLSGTSLSAFIMQTTWVWPLAEILHFVGLSLLIGIAGLFDLRLMGFFRSLPVGALHRLMPVAIAGFAINVLTGALFVIGTPFQYLTNPAFIAKVVFIALAGLNALLFERLVAKEALAVGPDEQAPRAARLIAAASLFSWLSVLYWGRMIAFIGDAF